MFFDSDAWPPPPDGFDPKPPGPRITPSEERIIMRMVGVLLLTMFLGPFAGSSVIVAVVAVFRSVTATGG